MLRTMLATAGSTIFSLATIGAALAMPLPAAPATAIASPATAALVEPVHGCHHGILRSRREAVGTGGWHFHDRACLRLDTAPPGYANAPGTRGSYATPLCSYRCRFIGPVKTCEQVCR